MTGGRLAAYVAMNALVGSTSRQFVVPYFRRHAEMLAELKAELGRDPTMEEMATALEAGRAAA